MTDHVSRFARAGLWALPIWAGLLFLATLTSQSDPQTSFPDFAAYVTTEAFLLSHLVASIAGAGIGSIGVIALMLQLQSSGVATRAIFGMMATVVANTLTSSIFGVAAFAQPAMGRAYLEGHDYGLDLYNQVYAGPLFGTVLVALLLWIAGGALMGAAIAGSGRLPAWAGWLYAISMIGFVLSNFLLPIRQSAISALLIISTLAVAWSARQEHRSQIVNDRDHENSYTAAR